MLCYACYIVKYTLNTNYFFPDIFHFSTAKGVQQRFAQEGGHYHHYFNQVFCGWDYLLAKEKSANFKHVILHQQIIVRANS